MNRPIANTLPGLVAQQSRIDREQHLPTRSRMVAATDLTTAGQSIDPDAATGMGDGWGLLHDAPARGLDGMEPWRIAVMRESKHVDTRDFAGALLGFTPIWTAEITLFDPARGQPCPVCRGVQGQSARRADGKPVLRPRQTCLICGSTRRNPVQEPMQVIADPKRRAKLGLAPLRKRVTRLRGGHGGGG